jgi:hypothetical protein
MTPILEMEGTGEQLAQELPKRLAEFKEQRLHITITPVVPTVSPATEPPRKKTITEILVEMGKAIPEEERAKIPPDLTDNLDHYIYGLPKK